VWAVFFGENRLKNEILGAGEQKDVWDEDFKPFGENHYLVRHLVFLLAGPGQIRRR
jgi:hypothetical protein